MNLLPLETWNIIISFLENNREKYYLLITCKDLSKCDVLFNDYEELYFILKSQWFDNFTNIQMSIFSLITKRPKKVKNIHYHYPGLGTIGCNRDYDGDSLNIFDNVVT